MKLSSALLVLASATQALAHCMSPHLVTSAGTGSDFQYIRQWTPVYSNSPVTSVSDVNLRCNGPTSGGSAVEVANVAAGSTVGFVSDTAVSHPGPFLAYMAKAPSGDVKSWDGSGAVWFKIWQKGPTSITSSAITWDTTSTSWSFAIPSSTPSGQYLLRMEHIGLHSAGSSGGAQFYMSCAQITVTNGGSGSPGPLVSIPGAYSASDPGILINIYYPIPTSYTPPGPAVWKG
ncbi:glycoside hydrolase [Geopyxis carbonaria]|nr:glycoside hydrolase [Geopyxis carbonaria]